MILQLVDALDLHRALDWSVDFEDPGNGVEWDYKFDEAVCRGLDGMLEKGQDKPICVAPGTTPIESEGWVMGNGHHRLSIFLASYGEVLVLFDEEGDWGHYGETS